MVFQQFNLFPHRTVLGNVIEAPMHVLGQSREQAIGRSHARCWTAWAWGQAAMHMPDTLSGGQQQRVAIARAWRCSPR